jgi:hypothetical protein
MMMPDVVGGDVRIVDSVVDAVVVILKLIGGELDEIVGSASYVVPVAQDHIAVDRLARILFGPEGPGEIGGRLEQPDDGPRPDIVVRAVGFDHITAAIGVIDDLGAVGQHPRRPAWDLIGR